MEKYIFNVVLNNGCKDHGFCSSFAEIKPKLKGAKYFDFCLSDKNQTDINALICWYGTGGFWYNCAHEKEIFPPYLCTLKQTEINAILAKEIKTY